MMGSLASLDDYVDWYNQTPMRGNAAPPPPAPPTGTTYDPMADRAVERPEPPQDPRAFTSEWARASGVYPGAFEPQGTQWPQYPPPPPKEVAEDRPNPLIPFSAYRSKPPTHRVGDIAAQNIIEQGFGALPAGRLGMGTALTLDPSPAEGAGIDPRLWSRLSSVKLRKPLDEMQHTYTGLTHPTPRITKPSEGIPTSQHFDDQWLENYLRHVKSVEER